jgi:hypothetical protein
LKRYLEGVHVVEKIKSLQAALAEMEANKKQLAEYQLKHAAEIKSENERSEAFNKRLDALSQAERRTVLDAAGLKHISAAPRPISPIKPSARTPAGLPPHLEALALQQQAELQAQKRERELSAMRVPPDKGMSISSQWLRPKTEAQTIAPVTGKVEAAKQRAPKWTDTELRTLLDESIQPSATNTSLGNKHGVTRQRIAALLKNANEKFSLRSKPKRPFGL